jgi:hypothetical protein
MKRLSTLLISFVALAASAQTVTVTFPPAANKARSYQVMIDGASYYSANSVASNGRSVTTIPNLSTGTHQLEVYTLTNRNTGIADGATTRPAVKPVYTKNFQLREGYDMNIAIRANGQVSFTEKRAKNTYTAGTQTPMTSTAFNSLVQNISGRRYQSDRITLVRNALSNEASYFTTTQVRQLLTLVSAESRRLELAKLSYARVTDPANFSSLYDVLQSEASRDALDNYVVAQGGSAVSTESNAAYGTALTDYQFTTLLNRVRGYSYQSGRTSEIRTALEGSNYFSTAQIRELLALVTAETDRLTLAKLAYSRVVDRSAFGGLADLFYGSTTRAEFNNFVTANGGVVTNTTYTPAMSDAAFGQVYNKARAHFFQKNTVADVQAALTSTANHFSTEQVRALLQLVTAETTRLELAKLGYARTVDPLNYYSLVDLFTVQANRTALENYIRSKQ